MCPWHIGALASSPIHHSPSFVPRAGSIVAHGRELAMRGKAPEHKKSNGQDMDEMKQEIAIEDGPGNGHSGQSWVVLVDNHRTSADISSKNLHQATLDSSEKCDIGGDCAAVVLMFMYWILRFARV